MLVNYLFHEHKYFKFLILQAWVDHKEKDTYIDTVSVRNSFPPNYDGF